MAALPIRQVEKPWGKDVLPAPFAAPEGTRIGEIWFEPPPELPELLVKYIFTSEKLSVQVHPSDAQTLARGIGRQGKEECWLIVAAEPGATLGIGFDTAIGEDELRVRLLAGLQAVHCEVSLAGEELKPDGLFETTWRGPRGSWPEEDAWTETDKLTFGL